MEFQDSVEEKKSHKLKKNTKVNVEKLEKWYQSPTLDDVPAMRLSPKWGWILGCVQPRTLAPKGVDWRVHIY